MTIRAAFLFICLGRAYVRAKCRADGSGKSPLAVFGFTDSRGSIPSIYLTALNRLARRAYGMIALLEEFAPPRRLELA